jgi:hypothetical protein
MEVEGKDEKSYRDLQEATRTLPLVLSKFDLVLHENITWKLVGFGVGALLAICAASHAQLSNKLDSCIVVAPENSGNCQLFENVYDLGWKIAVPAKFQVDEFAQNVLVRWDILSKIKCSLHWLFQKKLSRQPHVNQLLEPVLSIEHRIPYLNLEEVFLNLQANGLFKFKRGSTWTSLVSKVVSRL